MVAKGGGPGGPAVGGGCPRGGTGGFDPTSRRRDVERVSGGPTPDPQGGDVGAQGGQAAVTATSLERWVPTTTCSTAPVLLPWGGQSPV